MLAIGHSHPFVYYSKNSFVVLTITLQYSRIMTAIDRSVIKNMFARRYFISGGWTNFMTFHIFFHAYPK